MEPLMSVAQAAAVLGCRPAAIRKWISTRRLESVLVGRLRRIRPSSLERFITSASGQREEPIHQSCP
jgi:excisionase family DNA binding protein